MDKQAVMILYGGTSSEHEVSIRSAATVVRVMPEKYRLYAVYISRTGGWFFIPDLDLVEHPPEQAAGVLMSKGKGVFFRAVKGDKGIKACVSDNETCRLYAEADIVYPVLHGPNGEDGTLQGMLTLYGIPFVGAGVTGSAIGMDKDVMKRLLREAGIQIPRFIVYRDDSRSDIEYEKVVEAVGSPMFVKPANLGSSVGISRADDETSFETAVEEAFHFDGKIIIEEFIEGREIECSVLGSGRNIAASLPGEIVTRRGFYSYDAKYLDDDEAQLVIPADLEHAIQKRIQELAIRTFRVLCCDGMARVDFFIRSRDSAVIVNEINTLPGFTSISMYPKLWEASGVSMSELVDRLVKMGLERRRRENERLHTREK